MGKEIWSQLVLSYQKWKFAFLLYVQNIFILCPLFKSRACYINVHKLKLLSWPCSYVCVFVETDPFLPLMNVPLLRYVSISCVSGWRWKKKVGSALLSLLDVQKKRSWILTDSIPGMLIDLVELLSHLVSEVSAAVHRETAWVWSLHWFCPFRLGLISGQVEFFPSSHYFIDSTYFTEYLPCTRNLAMKSRLLSFGGSQTLLKYIID